MSILFTLTLLTYFGFIGFSFLTISVKKISLAIKLFISPSLGIAILGVILFSISRFGYAIDNFAFYLFMLSWVFIIPIVYFSTKKPFFPVKNLLYIVLIAIITISPYLSILNKFDFNWIGFVNGDFSYYSLSSLRFQNYGFSELPVSGNIIDLKDYSLFYWASPNMLGHRAGTEILLAYIVSITSYNAHQVYMPLSIAIQSTAIFATSALIYMSTKKISFVFMGVILLSLAPFFTIQTNLQLLAQIFGVSQLILSVILFSRVLISRDKGYVLLFTLSLSSLAIFYSEILPFLFLFMFLYLVLTYKVLFSTQETIKEFLYKLILFIVLSIVVLNSYIIDIFSFIKLVYFASNSNSNMGVVNNISLFPLFITPGFFALIWGLESYGGIPNSLSILIGLLFSLTLLIWAIRYRSKIDKVVLLMLMTLAGVGIYLFFKNHAYGLFKIGMLIQPFLIASLVIILFYYNRRFVTLALIGLIGIIFFYTQNANLKKVSNEIGISPVPFASTHFYVDQLKVISEELHKNRTCEYILSDTHTREMSMFQSYYFKGINFISPSFNQAIYRKDIRDRLGMNNISYQHFVFPGNISAQFQPMDSVDTGKESCMILSPKESSVVNQSSSPSGKRLTYKQLNDIENRLVFKQSSISTSTIGETLSLSQLEKDPLFNNNQTFSAIGRYHLYEVYGYKPDSRLVLSVTSTLRKKTHSKIPRISIVGNKVIDLETVGNGSARIISQPLEPKSLSNNNYLGIDFGREGEYFTSPKPFMMNLYNKDLYLDPRKITMFARNISLITDKQYETLLESTPTSLESFPESLMNEGLIYSGIYEDGWASDSFYVDLAIPKNGNEPSIYLSGMIPMIEKNNHNVTIEVYVNKDLVYTSLYPTGNFNTIIPISKYKKNKIVRLLIKTNNIQKLPNGDDREVGFLIKEISLKSKGKNEIQK